MALMTVGRVDLLLGKRPEVVVLLLKQLDSVTHLATVYTGYLAIGYMYTGYMDCSWFCSKSRV